MPHTHSHVLHAPTTQRLQRSTSANVFLFISASGSVGLTKLTSRLISIQEKYIYECMCLSSMIVTKQLFALTAKSKTTERLECSPKNTKIFTTYQDVHFPQPHDNTWLTFTWKLQQVLLFTDFFVLSVLLVSSFIVHIPKPDTLKPDSYISSSNSTYHS